MGAKPDDDAIMMERNRQKLGVVKELRALLVELDGDKTGTISFSELQKAANEDRIASRFDLLDITIREAEVFFQTMSSLKGTDDPSIDDFVFACMKMKGPAASIDVQAIGFQV